MSNFKDFDLDLKKVSVSKNEDEGINFAIYGKYKSVIVPTTGMSANCCRNSRHVNEGPAPRCI
ncbi:hypothetical protein PZQ55_003802 [Clostridium botulinum]|uniref:hypothetical protein n=1 Tax=Clostridium botulinum TaxID=1491 RepID=UPI000D115EA5|nr:hypothetical protein [Clostridium botulinum]AVQ46171.1 hypothetical protein C7M60_10425 [Clostridium botulinum]AVQ49789.1 hypothetical protein C7M58_10805 [Clostridium botulinum]EKO1911933.1 hypothetical protein [Clostridium botulinum]EKO1914643.1 hypothetical protein [Clostridium botulinum]EKO2041994.1 hypothetical protein [Clostridium botulinum]